MSRLRKHIYSGGTDDKYYIDCANYATNPQILELFKSMKETDVAILHAIATDNTITHKHRHIVVKISRSKSMVQNEFQIGNTLKHLPGFIKYICVYPCYDDTTRIMNDTVENAPPVKTTHQICNADKKETNLKHVLVMPYIHGGSLVSNNWTSENINDLKMIMIHTVLSLANAYEETGFIHNDLNWGNVLFKKTAVISITYNFSFTSVEIPTDGYKVVIMDFEKSYIGETNISVFWMNIRMFLRGMDIHNKKGEFVSWNNEDISVYIRRMMNGNKPIKNIVGVINLIRDSTFVIRPHNPLSYNPNVF